jgi:hypothetical protein
LPPLPEFGQGNPIPQSVTFPEAPQQLDVGDLDKLPGFIKQRYQQAKTKRQPEEDRWSKAYRNYRSELGTMPGLRDSERSQVAIKLTKVKTLAAYGQIIDVLFSGGKFPLELKESPKPEGISEKAHLDQTGQIDPNAPEDDIGFEGDDREVLPGATSSIVKPAQVPGDKYEGVGLAEGEGFLGEPTVFPARDAAFELNKTVQDQLNETKAIEETRRMIFEMCLLGTGVIKGPFNVDKTIHKWVVGENGEREYDPFTKLVPRLQQTSCWNLYPDPSANTPDEFGWMIERHKLNHEQSRSLMDFPGFNKEALQKCIDKPTGYVLESWESALYDNNAQYLGDLNEAFEYWGVIDKKFAEANDIKIPQKMSDLDSVMVNIWICGTEVLRAIVNPLTPKRIPYLFVPYERDPYRPWGVGVPENMADSQLLINGHYRMAIDNLALAGNVILEIDDNMLVQGQSLNIFPGKVFRRQSGVKGNAITAIQIPNVAPAHLQMIQQAMQIADMETGIPSVMHGQTGVSGTGRTSSGLAMILGSASMNIKTVIKNIDDFYLTPTGWNYFFWNMQFNNDLSILDGDLEVHPKATAALMAKEIRSQRLLTFAQTAAGIPLLAPWLKWERVATELATALEINPKDIINDAAAAAIVAKQLERFLQNEQGNGSTSGSPNGESINMGGVGGVPQGSAPTNSSGTGGGQIGVGNVPSPGESGFTGNAP